MPWLDAMRGFTMVLVVAYHVAQISFGQNEKLSASLPLLALLRMPAFFFVSGFLATRIQPLKKLRVQLVPTAVFLCACVALRKPHFWPALVASLASPTKGGYWYTLVLLQMFLIYYMVRACARGRAWPLWMLWIASLAAYCTLYLPRQFTYWHQPFYSYTSAVFTIKFMHFFVAGSLVRRYWPQVQRAMDGRWLFPAMAAVAALCLTEVLRWHTLRMEWTNLPRTAAMYSLLAVTVMAFRASANNARLLSHIGQNTLPIYLMHFILLPQLPMVGTWLNRYQPGFVVEVLCALAGAAAVIAACLGLTRALGTSALIRKHLFGR